MTRQSWNKGNTTPEEVKIKMRATAKAQRGITKERLLERRVVTSEGCWIIPGRQAYVYHRKAWEFWRGPIPPKMMVCHKCDNGFCFNPKHLFLGTNSDNMKDMNAKGRSNYFPMPLPTYEQRAKGEHGGMWKGIITSEKAIAIYNDTRTQRVIAESYGISQPSVTAIKTGRNWNHVTGHRQIDR